jgi:Protein of unknown function (DUF3253)
VTPEDAILTLLARRAAGATICPSEAARIVAGPDGEWRSLMGDVRSAAASLVNRGLVEVTQRGVVVDVRSARAPVRLRLRDAPSA